MQQRVAQLLILGSCVLAVSSGCRSDGVGDPCVPEEEYDARSSGFAVTEVSTESRSFQCQTRVCLVNHFQGRVSCPYGQSETEASSAPQCRIPGTGTPIQTAVDPQLRGRRADDAVYCSCRCDGPDQNARYCECPSGYACVKLVPDLALGQEQLTGSYCVRDGTVYDKTALSPSDVCDRSQGNCD